MKCCGCGTYRVAAEISVMIHTIIPIMVVMPKNVAQPRIMDVLCLTSERSFFNFS